MKIPKARRGNTPFMVEIPGVGIAQWWCIANGGGYWYLGENQKLYRVWLSRKLGWVKEPIFVVNQAGEIVFDDKCHIP